MDQTKRDSFIADPLSLSQIAELVGGRTEGDPTLQIRGVAPLDQAREDEMALLAQRRYLKRIPDCRARCVLVSEALAGEAGAFSGRVVVKDPHEALPPLLALFHPSREREPGIHATAVLEKGVVLGEGVRISAYAVLEEGVEVGDGVDIGAHCVLGAGSAVGGGSVLHPHVVLYPGTRLGARVILHAGVKLGVDGFGYVPTPEGYRKVPQVGGCMVENDVEIGANSCVDRGSIGRTVVGEGTKLDNLVHIAHNVQVGREVLMAAMVGIAGSTRVGDRAMFGGQSGAAGHLEVGEGVQASAQAGIIRDVPPGEVVAGFPARNHREFFKALGILYRLPETLKRLDALEARFKEEQGRGKE